MAFVTINRVLEKPSDLRTCSHCGRTRPLGDFQLVSPQIDPRLDPTSLAGIREYHRLGSQLRRGKVCRDCPSPAELAELAKEARGGPTQVALELAALWGEHSLHHPNPSPKRLAAVARATPRWVNEKPIRALYAEAEALTGKTGTRHYVEHITPVLAKHVCGLHVHWNLRWLTA